MSRLPDEVVLEAEAAYRAELADSLPGARDSQRLERGMVNASILWLWQTLAGWHLPGALTRDERWGLATVRQRILFRLGLVTNMLAIHGWYEATRAVTQTVHERLQTRWPEVAGMPPYAAFAQPAP